MSLGNCRGSEVEGQKSRVASRGSRVASRGSRVSSRGSRVACRGSYFEGEKVEVEVKSKGSEYKGLYVFLSF